MKRCVRLESLLLSAELDFSHIVIGFFFLFLRCCKKTNNPSTNLKPLGFLTRRYEVSSLKVHFGTLVSVYPSVTQVLRLNAKWYSENKTFL